jgi:hypothetical protein
MKLATMGRSNVDFKTLKINLVSHDTSPTGCPAFIEIHLGKTPKDKGLMALDLGNYVYRLGFRYQFPPEYRGKGKSSVLRLYLSWQDLEPYRLQICKAHGSTVDRQGFLPFEFRSMSIQEGGVK